MDQLLRGCATIKDAGVALFQDDHATTLDAFVTGVHGGGHEIGESDVGDEAAALFHL